MIKHSYIVREYRAFGDGVEPKPIEVVTFEGTEEELDRIHRYNDDLTKEFQAANQADLLLDKAGGKRHHVDDIIKRLNVNPVHVDPSTPAPPGYFNIHKVADDDGDEQITGLE